MADQRTASLASNSPEATRLALLDGLARRYSASLLRFFNRRLSDSSDAADLVQDVLVRLSRLQNIDTIEKPEHYLFVAAGSALRDRQRRDAVRDRGNHEPFKEARHGGSDLTPERVLAGKQALARLEAALGDLPERTRDIFVLRVFEGLRMAEISRMLSLSQRAVEKHYAKAMAFLTARLAADRDG